MKDQEEQANQCRGCYRAAAEADRSRVLDECQRIGVYLAS